MKYYTITLCLLVTFAIAVGDFTFRTWYPSTTPEYTMGGVVHPLLSPAGSETKKHIYLRRSWYLTEPPSRAWLQIMGHDEIEVFVNGQNVGRSSLVGVGRIAGVLGDITTYLHSGHNVIAIHVLQSVIDRPPAAAIDGQFEFPDGSQISLADPKGWRSGDIYDHHGLFWYETEFHDAHWVTPSVGDAVNWRAQVDLPPRSVTEPRHSQWINPAKAEGGAAAMARSFTLPGRPNEGWLRVIATGPYRVAINGWLVVDDQTDLASVPPEPPLERTFDVSAFLRSGANNVSIMVTTPGEAPRLRADLEATTADGQRVYVGTDDSWKSLAGAAAGWQRADLSRVAWQPCTPEVGFVGVVPYTMQREMDDIFPSVAFWLARAAADGCLIVACGLVAGAGCILVGRFLRRRSNDCSELTLLPFVALLPSAILAAAAALATWDLGWTGHDMYQAKWVFGLWALVGLQWSGLMWIAVGRAMVLEDRVNASSGSWTKRLSYGVVLCWAVLFGVALWMRLQNITAEPLHHDEVTCYAFTMGVRQYGFPGGQVDPDIPFGWCATSELTYYTSALCSFFVDDPRLVLRIPTTLWSMATMALLGYMGWKWFNSRVAFIAAALYAFSPHVIGMADFGRYLSQVQFFTLLTMYLTYEAVRGTGTPPLGLLWGSAISFCAMYLSWEGTGFFGIGLTLAVLFHRRRHLRPIFTCPHFYYASTVVGLVVLGQYAHRVMQQTERIWYGEGINSLTVKPMWTYPNFDALFFLTNTSWIRDALLPLIGLVAACLLMVKHRWRFPLRFSIICLVTNAELMSFLLPLRTNRYSYHLCEILILVSAAAAVAGAEMLLGLVRTLPRHGAYRWYVGATATGALLAITVMASGRAVRTEELDGYVTNAYDINQLRNPNWSSITDYLLAHVGKNDAVIALYPHAENFEMASRQGPSPEPRRVDYWLESKLIVEATIGDTIQMPRDRRSGAKMLYNLDQIEKLFSEHDRIWYCTMRYGHSKINEGDVSRYLREHMDVVYEDFDTALMVRDRNSRPANVRLGEEDSEELATDYYLK